VVTRPEQHRGNILKKEEKEYPGIGLKKEEKKRK